MGVLKTSKFTFYVGVTKTKKLKNDYKHGKIQNSCAQEA